MGLLHYCACGKVAGENEICPRGLESGKRCMKRDVMTPGLLGYLTHKLIFESVNKDDADENTNLSGGYLAQVERDLAFYEHGFKKTVPKAWKHIVDQYYKEYDHDYRKYLELKKKFEDDCVVTKQASDKCPMCRGSGRVLAYFDPCGRNVYAKCDCIK